MVALFISQFNDFDIFIFKSKLKKNHESEFKAKQSENQVIELTKELFKWFFFCFLLLY